MWHSIKRWRDWVDNLGPPFRFRPRLRSLHIYFELAGITRHDEPIPWNADAVQIDVVVELPHSHRRRSDFALRIGDHSPALPSQFRSSEPNGGCGVAFRIPTPAASTHAELLWRGRVIARVELPVIDAPTFVRGLQLHLPAVGVRVGRRQSAARTFVASQYRGLVAGAVLSSPTILAPLEALGITAEFRHDDSDRGVEIEIHLSESQRAACEALVTAIGPRPSRRPGIWTVTWRVGSTVLATQQVRAVSRRLFFEPVQLIELRFDVGGRLRRTLPMPNESEVVRPVVVVASGEPGMAGLAAFRLIGAGPGIESHPLTPPTRALITDHPTSLVFDELDVKSLAAMTTLELRSRGVVIGSVSLSPRPTAQLTPEGGFEPMPDYAWTQSAEDELSERLGRLIDEPRE